ncbi:hypothetical protein CYLTODRAFT_415292 [Cylindrobasidium torrendii FP15055 ss-10]|uniref:Uncharacterized protein n=1 Tax=Cylindrobasidium torrendii FP15055 ss-10 TaxID=1314674 RepID=A0A0D7ATF5_9AGAR|nr:hypothetical protein CYLTODRAFT_415292 [Cylindrobasidium torrendii FP15055 ss-10]
MVRKTSVQIPNASDDEIEHFETDEPTASGSRLPANRIAENIEFDFAEEDDVAEEGGEEPVYVCGSDDLKGIKFVQSWAKWLIKEGYARDIVSWKSEDAMKRFVFETVMPALMQEFDLDFPSQHLWAVGQKVYKFLTNKRRGPRKAWTVPPSVRALTAFDIWQRENLERLKTKRDKALARYWVEHGPGLKKAGWAQMRWYDTVRLTTYNQEARRLWAKVTPDERSDFEDEARRQNKSLGHLRKVHTSEFVVFEDCYWAVKLIVIRCQEHVGQILEKTFGSIRGHGNGQMGKCVMWAVCAYESVTDGAIVVHQDVYGKNGAWPEDALDSVLKDDDDLEDFKNFAKKVFDSEDLAVEEEETRQALKEKKEQKKAKSAAAKLARETARTEVLPLDATERCLIAPLKRKPVKSSEVVKPSKKTGAVASNVALESSSDEDDKMDDEIDDINHFATVLSSTADEEKSHDDRVPKAVAADSSRPKPTQAKALRQEGKDSSNRSDQSLRSPGLNSDNEEEEVPEPPPVKSRSTSNKSKPRPVAKPIGLSKPIAPSRPRPETTQSDNDKDDEVPLRAPANSNRRPSTSNERAAKSNATAKPTPATKRKPTAKSKPAGRSKPAVDEPTSTQEYDESEEEDTEEAVPTPASKSKSTARASKLPVVEEVEEDEVEMPDDIGSASNIGSGPSKPNGKAANTRTKAAVDGKQGARGVKQKAAQNEDIEDDNGGEEEVEEIRRGGRKRARVERYVPDTKVMVFLKKRCNDLRMIEPPRERALFKVPVEVYIIEYATYDVGLQLSVKGNTMPSAHRVSPRMGCVDMSVPSRLIPKMVTAVNSWSGVEISPVANEFVKLLAAFEESRLIQKAHKLGLSWPQHP